MVIFPILIPTAPSSACLYWTNLGVTPCRDTNCRYWKPAVATTR